MLPVGTEVVLFDAGGVLLLPDWERVAAAIRGLGAPAEAAALAVAAAEVPAAAGKNDRERWQAYVEAVYSAAAGSTLRPWIHPLYDQHMAEHFWSRPAPEANAVLTRLRGAGLRLGVVSNSTGAVGAELVRAGLSHQFEHVLDSALEGVEKPDPVLFRRALDRMGVVAARTVFVGDTWDVDIEGARAVGMHTVFVSRRATSIRPSIQDLWPLVRDVP
ncbi:MAG: HAD family hydrolase [Pseudomonadota bacterium]|nr:HAD family hydrolase [Pseudomonadota bacterium]